MSEYETEFPKSTSSFLKAANFQDQDVSLTFVGWKKKPNEDVAPAAGKQGISWKQRLKYTLRYSFPQFAIDEVGEKILGKDGQPFQNRNYDPNYPQGYFVIYSFEEGQLESGSLPLFNAFCMIRPKTGDVVIIKRTGKDKETKWQVSKVQRTVAHMDDDMPSVDFSDPEYSGDKPEEPPF